MGKKAIATLPSKEIMALSDFEHVLLRPDLYVGPVEESDEVTRVIKNGTIETKTKPISLGFYKLMNEILDNSFDEAKRLNGKMSEIKICFDSKTNKVTVSDSGEGFLKGTEKNKKTKKNNIETALSILRAGSNFKNNEIENSVLGTHGIGASVVNMLSDEFEIHTVNKTHNYKQKWHQFKTVEKIEEKRKAKEKTGTKISFIPRKDKFKKCKWDFEYIEALMIFKEFIRKNDPILSKVNFEVYFDDIKLNLNKQFIPDDCFLLDSKIGTLVVWERKNSDTKHTSFINTALCSGIHQTIIQDSLNELFDYKHSHIYYSVFLVINISPKYVRFGDQSKIRLAVGRWEIEPILEKYFLKQIKRNFKKTDLFKRLSQKIKERVKSEEIQSLKKAVRSTSKKIISDKYVPPSERKGTFFIVEGDSAMGGLMQKRNTESDGIYRLKGKIKNAKTIGDLSKNSEIVDLINILGLDLKKSTKCDYDKIIIATDWDPDGIGHIASLLINLFYKWFKFIIDHDKLFILITPLVSVDVNKDRKYFYSSKEFSEYTNSTTDKYSNVRYLKGLGSLAIRDWDFIMKKRDCYRIYADRSAKKFLWMSFDGVSLYRKKWLEGTI